MTREEIRQKAETLYSKTGFLPSMRQTETDEIEKALLEVAGIAWEEGCLMALKTRDDYEHLCDSAWLNESPYKQDVVEKT
jgi:hypothetical protein